MANTISASALLNAPFLSTITPVKVRNNRHQRRCGWYYRPFFRFYQHIQYPLLDYTRVKNGTEPFRTFTDREVQLAKEICERMEELYNSRYNSYRQLLAEEGGYEYCPRLEPNKTIWNEADNYKHLR